ncbi:MAG: rhamnogalacturonan acetylesterase [Asticcacaulis sp.]
MKKHILPLAICLSLMSLPVAAQSAPEPVFLPLPKSETPVSVTDADVRRKTAQVRLRKIILVGDSTVQSGSGWGGAFCAFNTTPYVTCVNMAIGGRSTFSYRAEGSWDYALNETRQPDFAQVYVLIQFGHNDQPGKPGRSTDLDSEYSENLRQYVRDVRAAGAIPVLVTPLVRRSFVNGSLQDTLYAWADQVRAVAKEMDVPLIDLHATSLASVQAMGPVDSLELSQKRPSVEVIEAAKTGTSAGAFIPGAAPATSTEVAVTGQQAPAVTFDYTHVGENGAKLFARQVAAELVKVVPDLHKRIVP